MKSIMVTYPGFGLLPKGVKQLLLASENFFFEQAMSPPHRGDEKAESLPHRGKDSKAIRQVWDPAWMN